MRILIACLLCLVAPCLRAQTLISVGAPSQTNIFIGLYGDSIYLVTWSNAFMTNYPWLLRGTYTNAAVDGSESTQLAQEYPVTMRPLRRTSPQQEFWFPIETGINDINRGSNASVVITNLITLWSFATNDGWVLSASTLGNSTAFPVGGPSNLQQVAVNGWIRTNFLKWTTHLMEPDRMFQSMSDTVISYDGVHPTAYARVKFAQHLAQVMRRDDGLRTIVSTNSDAYVFGTPAPAVLHLGVNDRTNLTLNTDGSVNLNSNKANFGNESTNDIVPGQITLGPAQRFDVSLDVYGTATLSAGFAATLMYSNSMTGVIQAVGRLTTPAGLIASDVVTNQLVLVSANPNSMFWITNTAGGQSVSVVPNSCRLIGR